jgi:hypothetical protein
MLAEAGLLLSGAGSIPDRSGCLTPSTALGTGSAGRFARSGTDSATPPAYAGVGLRVVRDYVRYHSDDATRTALSLQTHTDRGKVLLTCLQLWLTLRTVRMVADSPSVRCASSSRHVVGRVFEVREP